MRNRHANESSTPDRSRRRRRGGFTLVELMVVIVILGGLIAIVGPNVFRALFESDVSRAETQMNSFAMSIKMYYFNNRKLPASLDELTQADPRSGEPYMESVPKDPWGTPYELRPTEGAKFEIMSYGRDLIEGTEDDIRWPKQEDD